MGHSYIATSPERYPYCRRGCCFRCLETQIDTAKASLLLLCYHFVNTVEYICCFHSHTQKSVFALITSFLLLLANTIAKLAVNTPSTSINITGKIC